MSTTTSNLALTKPASGESYSLDVVNGNTQKIDDFAGGVNTNLSKLNTAAAYASNQNLNNYTTTGSYHVGTDTSSSPTGATIYGILVVYSAHDTIVQIFIRDNNDIFTRVKPNSSLSWTGWKNTSGKQALTITRTANNFVDATEIGRCFAVKKNGILFFRLNVGPTATATGFSDFVEIARISGWSSEMQILQNIPPQDGSSKPICLQISTGGVVSIYGANGLSASFYRAQIAVPEA